MRKRVFERKGQEIRRKRGWLQAHLPDSFCSLSDDGKKWRATQSTKRACMRERERERSRRYDFIPPWSHGEIWRRHSSPSELTRKSSYKYVERTASKVESQWDQRKFPKVRFLVLVTQGVTNRTERKCRVPQHFNLPEPVAFSMLRFFKLRAC